MNLKVLVNISYQIYHTQQIHQITSNQKEPILSYQIINESISNHPKSQIEALSESESKISRI